jgi:hypothetical protein
MKRGQTGLKELLLLALVTDKKFPDMIVRAFCEKQSGYEGVFETAGSEVDLILINFPVFSLCRSRNLTAERSSQQTEFSANQPLSSCPLNLNSQKGAHL